MKINNGYNDPQANAANSSQRAQETAAAGTNRTGSGNNQSRADEVNLSSLAAAVQSALSDSPERAARLERLAAEFAAGDYQTDATSTARSLIDETLSAQDDGRERL
jgi:flagellar biosynthesis anti-sigma factor FlgM